MSASTARPARRNLARPVASPATSVATPAGAPPAAGGWPGPEEKAAELAQRTQPDPAKPPLEQLSDSLAAYLAWVEENAGSYEKLIRSASVPEMRALLAGEGG